MNVGERASLIPWNPDGSPAPVTGDPVVEAPDGGLPLNVGGRAERHRLALIRCPYDGCGALLGLAPLSP